MIATANAVLARQPRRAHTQASTMPTATITASTTASPPKPPSQIRALLRHRLYPE